MLDIMQLLNLKTVFQLTKIFYNSGEHQFFISNIFSSKAVVSYKKQTFLTAVERRI